MNRKSDSSQEGSANAAPAYDPPRIVHEEKIEAVAVACDPASNPGLPVKNFDGEITAFSVCQNGFLNS